MILTRRVSSTDRASLLARLLLVLLRLYQITVSPLLGAHCRFDPSCSHYAADAIRAHGALRGIPMAVQRLSRCHPFHGGGYDPVP